MTIRNVIISALLDYYKDSSDPNWMAETLLKGYIRDEVGEGIISIHQQFENSNHCQLDGEIWPCSTMKCLGQHL